MKLRPAASGGNAAATIEQGADTMSTRADNEIGHGQYLAAGDTERLWGWGTPAGRLRATRRADIIRDMAGLGPGVRALEIGCGTGNFTERFAESRCDLVAVDISPDLLEKAGRRHFPHGNVRFLNMRFEDAAELGPFDAVIGSSILHHLEMPLALRVIFGLLKPGGKIAFAEPNLLNPQVYLERRFSHWKLFSYVSPDETAFIRGGLRRMLAETRFRDIRIEPFDWLHPAVPAPCIPLAQRLGRVLERLPLVREFAGSLAISASRP